jgi:hypothetical protein
MKCPYLSNASKKKCVKMLAENIDEELSDFDLKHFCDGNPIYCYYFRLPALQAAAKLSKDKVSLEKVPKEVPLPTASLKSISLKTERNPWQE